MCFLHVRVEVFAGDTVQMFIQQTCYQAMYKSEVNA